MQFEIRIVSSNSTCVSDVLPWFLICRESSRQLSTTVLGKCCSAWLDDWWLMIVCQIVGELGQGFELLTVTLYMCLNKSFADSFTQQGPLTFSDKHQNIIQSLVHLKYIADISNPGYHRLFIYEYKWFGISISPTDMLHPYSIWS